MLYQKMKEIKMHYTKLLNIMQII